MYKNKTKTDIIRIPHFGSPLFPREPDYALEPLLLHKIGSLFLVMSYDAKYSKLENAIKNFFKDKYDVHMAKDSMQDILGCVCEKIKESDFGIVVLAGLKFRKQGKNRIKMNIPFEYGMLKINVDISVEFSDVQNENHGEKFAIKRQTTQIEKRIGEIFSKFIPELARNAAEMTLDEIVAKHPSFPLAKRKDLLKLYKTQCEIIIRKDFEDKIGAKKEK
jgi:hypothetical protein